MPKFSWLPIAILALAACARQPMASSTSRFLPTTPTIDGLTTDWTDSLHYDAGSKLEYQVLNDAHTVYVRVKAPDPSTQAKVILQGLTVWLDTTGRNQQQFGVHYPIDGGLGALRARSADSPGANGAPADRQARLAQALAGMHEMELLNYKGSKEPTLTDTQSQLGVHVAAALDEQGSLVYELAVPMRLLYHKAPALTASGKKAVVGVTFAGTKWSPPNGGTAGGGGMRGGGMGGPGGGMGGGMRGGGMRGGGGMGGGMRSSGGYQQASATISLKTSVQLASQ